MVYEIELILLKDGMSVTSMYSDGQNDFHIVIPKDKFDSYVRHLDEIRITVNANDFYNIIKNVISDILIFTIEEYYDGCEDLLVQQFMMISEENDNEIYSSLVFKTFTVDETEYVVSESENIPFFDAPQGIASLRYVYTF